MHNNEKQIPYLHIGLLATALSIWQQFINKQVYGTHKRLAIFWVMYNDKILLFILM